MELCTPKEPQGVEALGAGSGGRSKERQGVTPTRRSGRDSTRIATLATENFLAPAAAREEQEGEVSLSNTAATQAPPLLAGLLVCVDYRCGHDVLVVILIFFTFMSLFIMVFILDHDFHPPTPLRSDDRSENQGGCLRSLATSLGAEVTERVKKGVTHLVFK